MNLHEQTSMSAEMFDLDMSEFTGAGTDSAAPRQTPTYSPEC